MRIQRRMPGLPYGRNKGFTQAELLVVVGIVAIIAGLVVPALQNARTSANRSWCANNLRQVGMGYQMFVDNHKSSAFIGDAEWINRLLPFVSQNKQIFVCLSQTADSSLNGTSDMPGRLASRQLSGGLYENGRIVVIPNADGTLTVNLPTRGISPDRDDGDDVVVISPIGGSGESGPSSSISTNEAAVSYGVNNAAQNLGSTDRSQKVLVVEYKRLVANVVGAAAPDFWPVECAPRHSGMLNVLFADGTVRDMAPSDIDPRLTKIYNANWLPEIFRD